MPTQFGTFAFARQHTNHPQGKIKRAKSLPTLLSDSVENFW